MREDFQDGTLEQIIILQPNLEVFILAKMLGNWLIFSLPISLLILPLGFAIGLNQALTVNFFLLLLLASLAINFICAFCGSLSIAGNKAPMIAILAMPLIIPILLIACGSLIDVGVQSSDFYLPLKILCGICIFVGTISVMATAKIVKIIAE